MSRNGKIVIGLLVGAIILVQVLFPAPKSGPKRIRTADPPPPRVGNRGVSPARSQPPSRPPAPAPRTQPANISAGMSFSDFELLRERYGRNDPFSPFFDIREFTGDDIDLPDVGPLPPMILQNPSSMDLTAIALKDGIGTCVVNGEILRVGDTMLGFTIESINIDRVELVNELEDRAILRLKQKTIPGFSVAGNRISNIEEDIPAGGYPNDLIPYIGPNNIPDVIGFPAVPAEEPEDEAQPEEEALESLTQPVEAVQEDPVKDTLKQIDKILSMQENEPH